MQCDCKPTTSPCVCSHIGSASGQAWKEGKMDFTGAQMVLTLKLISVAVCYQDGLKKEEVRKGA
jgi:lysophospholipid acyltransferase